MFCVRAVLAPVLLLLLATSIGCEAAPDDAGGRTIVVYAAASLTDALGAVADSFEAAHPEFDVLLNVAATSLLARQIESGAPADVFFSANLDWMRRLEERGYVAGPVTYPLRNRLVVVGRKGSTTLMSPHDLVTLPRIALGDPSGVPAGIYAREALRCAGLWERLASHVVPTLDVRAVMMAVRHGAADAAIVYTSDVLVDPHVDVLFEWPEACHPDVRYAVARLRQAGDPKAASQFLQFAVHPDRAELWSRFGFIPDLAHETPLASADRRPRR